jgi:hypothetical protein
MGSVVTPGQYWLELGQLLTRRGKKWEPNCAVCGCDAWGDQHFVDAIRDEQPSETYLAASCTDCGAMLFFDLAMVNMLLGKAGDTLR